jgi:hypothetical protein
MPPIYAPGVTNEHAISGTTKSTKNCLDVNVVSTEGNDFTLYEAKTFTITGAETNYNVDTEESMFSTVATSKVTTVYADVACTVRLNLAAASTINLLAGEEIRISGYPVTNLFITTTADTVVRVVLFG